MRLTAMRGGQGQETRVSGWMRGLAMMLTVAMTATAVAPLAAQGTTGGQRGAAPPATSTTGRGATPPQGRGTAPATPAPVQAPLPLGYQIGPDDVLRVDVLQDPTMSADVVVRPDGKISLQQINDVQAAGLTPEELRQNVIKAAATLFKDPPAVTVSVRQIKSRNVYITGQVGKAGQYPLAGPMTVLQLITMAGGLSEYAKKEKIVVIRPGLKTPLKVNYKELMEGKKLEQNIELRPGDQVIVP